MTNEQTTSPETIANEGLIPLRRIDDHVLIHDMNYQFYYDRVKKPDRTNSNYFALHYKEEQQELWTSCPSLLTTVFTIAKTEYVINQIQESLEGAISDERHYRSGTSVKSSFTLSGYQIDIEDEPDVDKVLFQLITNIETGLDVLTSANLTFNLINGFSGNHALQLNYGLMKTMQMQVDDETKILPINNIFVLDRFTKRLIHDNNLSISIEDVTNVQQAIQNQINNYHRIPVTQEIVNEFVEKFPKKISKKFVALYDNIPENLRNFYYVTYILSVLLDNERNISLEIKLRKFVSEKIEFILSLVDEDAVITE